MKIESDYSLVVPYYSGQSLDDKEQRE